MAASMATLAAQTALVSAPSPVARQAHGARFTRALRPSTSPWLDSPLTPAWAGTRVHVGAKRSQIIVMARRGLKDVATTKKKGGGARKDLKAGEYSAFECFARRKGAESWLNWGAIAVLDGADVDAALQERAAKITSNVQKAVLQLATVPQAEREFAYERAEQMVVVDLTATTDKRQPATLLLNEPVTASGFGAFRSSLPVRSEKGMPGVDGRDGQGRRKI